jgi:hypothetical protein
MSRRYMLKFLTVVTLASLSFVGMAGAEKPVRKIGFSGLTGSPAAAWGTLKVRLIETYVAWIKQTGDGKIGNIINDVKIVTFGIQKAPKRSVARMEKIAQRGMMSGGGMMGKVEIPGKRPPQETSTKYIEGYKQAKVSCTQCHAMPHPNQHSSLEWPSVIKKMEKYIRENNKTMPNISQQKSIINYYTGNSK